MGGAALLDGEGGAGGLQILADGGGAPPSPPSGEPLVKMYILALWNIFLLSSYENIV